MANKDFPNTVFIEAIKQALRDRNIPRFGVTPRKQVGNYNVRSNCVDKRTLIEEAILAVEGTEIGRVGGTKSLSFHIAEAGYEISGGRAAPQSDDVFAESIKTVLRAEKHRNFTVSARKTEGHYTVRVKAPAVNDQVEQRFTGHINQVRGLQLFSVAAGKDCYTFHVGDAIAEPPAAQAPKKKITVDVVDNGTGSNVNELEITTELVDIPAPETAKMWRKDLRALQTNGLVDKTTLHRDGTATLAITYYNKNGRTPVELFTRLQGHYPYVAAVDLVDEFKEWPEESRFAIKVQPDRELA